MNMNDLQQRADKAVQTTENELPKPWSMERAPIAVANEKRSNLNNKAGRVGMVRTAVSMLENASQDFDKKVSMKNQQLRLETQISFKRIGHNNPYLQHMMGIAGQRISAFNPETKEHHDGRWDNHEPVIVFQLIKASIIHWHKTNDDVIPHLIETLKASSIADFKYKVDAKLDKKADDQLLKDMRDEEKRAAKAEAQRKRDYEFKIKLQKAKDAKAKRDADDELIAWLKEQECA